jgi:hypothetical protein
VGDLRYAVRLILKRPGFSLLIVLILDSESVPIPPSSGSSVRSSCVRFLSKSPDGRSACSGAAGTESAGLCRIRIFSICASATCSPAACGSCGRSIRGSIPAASSRSTPRSKPTSSRGYWSGTALCPASRRRARRASCRWSTTTLVTVSSSTRRRRCRGRRTARSFEWSNSVCRDSSETVFAAVFQDQRDRVFETLAALIEGATLPVSPRNLRTVADQPVAVVLEDRRELVVHLCHLAVS